jgi:hypothetical protein
MILYLLPQGLKKLRQTLEDWLRVSEKRRIVTIIYSVPGWETGVVQEYERSRSLYYYDKTELKL